MKESRLLGGPRLAGPTDRRRSPASFLYLLVSSTSF